MLDHVRGVNTGCERGTDELGCAQSRHAIAGNILWQSILC